MLSSCILFERRICTNMWKLNQFYFNEKPGNIKDQTELNSFLVQVLYIIIMYSIEKEKVIEHIR